MVISLLLSRCECRGSDMFVWMSRLRMHGSTKLAIVLALFGAGFVAAQNPHDPAMKYLRAPDIETGKIAWETPQVGPVEYDYSRVLATSTGLYFTVRAAEHSPR